MTLRALDRTRFVSLYFVVLLHRLRKALILGIMNQINQGSVKSMRKVVIITGGTSSIGLETARLLTSRGCKVYELSRRENGTDVAVHIQADVTDENQVRNAVESVLRQEGHIDIVINNAGFGISGAIEYTDTEEAIRQFDVNFFGMVRVNRAVLPIMHRQGHGRIINMSSVAAPIAIPFQAYYSASKAAVRTYTLALYS